MISTSLSPNTEQDDIRLASKLLRRTRQWIKGKAPSRLEKEFRTYLGIKYAFAFNSGRSCLLAILRVLGIKQGDEVLLQAFTCNAAVNPILKCGAKPIFVDIDETINLDPIDLENKITTRSKAVIVQHTFGWPAKINMISNIAKRHNLFLIEDCAHSLGAKTIGIEHEGQTSPPIEKSKFCGTFGDVAFFSLGRDKIISSVFGGIAITNNKELARKIKVFQEIIPYPRRFWVFQQLLHPIITNRLVTAAYQIHPLLGRILLGGLHKVFILSKAVYKKEKRGKLSSHFPKKMANVLAILGLNQFKKLNRFNQHRRQIARFYERELSGTSFILPFAIPREGRIPVFMRYPILIHPFKDHEPIKTKASNDASHGVSPDTDYVLAQARKKRILLNDGWRKTPIVPPDTDQNKMAYIPGSCPRAEQVAKNIINLPTHINISKKQAQKIVSFIKSMERSRPSLH